MFRFGLCARSHQFAIAIKHEVDYLEPVIYNDMVKRDGDHWSRNPDHSLPDAPPSFAVLFPGDFRLADPAFSHDDIVDYLAVVFDRVAATSAPGAKVVLGSGAARRIPEDVDLTTGAATFAGVVRLTAQMARERGIGIVLEPLNKGETNLLHTIAECAAFLDEHGIDVPIVADLYHMMLEGEGIGILETLGTRIGHAHLADTGRTPPGQGDWPIAAFIQKLKQCGYRGDVSIECLWKDLDAELPGALRFLRDVRVSGV